jgi:hypothetical protein
MVAGHVAEEPVAGQPELGDDVERDHVADQRVGLFRELGGQVGGRVRIGGSPAPTVPGAGNMGRR